MANGASASDRSLSTLKSSSPEIYLQPTEDGFSFISQKPRVEGSYSRLNEQYCVSLFKKGCKVLGFVGRKDRGARPEAPLKSYFFEADVKVLSMYFNTFREKVKIRIQQEL